MRILAIAALAWGAACTTGADDELRDLRADVRDLRQDVRDVKEALRKLEPAASAPAPTAPDPDPAAPAPSATDGGSPAAPASPTAARDGGPPAAAPRPVALRINSAPSAAAVYVDDKLTGRTPMVLERPRGGDEVTIRVEKPGFRPHVTNVRPREDLDVHVVLEPLGRR